MSQDSTSAEPEITSRRFALKVLLAMLALCWLAAPGDSRWVLLLANCAYVAFLISTRHELPPRMASQFDFKLQAQGWISRRTYFCLLGGMGLGISLTLAIMSAFMERAGIHFMARHVLWIASALVGFMASVHALTVEANRHDPPRLSKMLWAALALFQATVLLWVAAIITHEKFGWPP